MIKEKLIELRKKRDLGAILTDSFAFIRTQFKPFFSTFLKLVGPYLVFLLLVNVLYLRSFSSLLDFSGNIETSNDMYGPLMMFGTMILFLIAFSLVYAMAQSVTLHYMKNYIKNNGQTDYHEIKGEVYATFWKFIGMSILANICIVIGTILCFIPGVYLFVPLSLTYSILIFEKKSIGDAFSYSFTLVKDYWWITFATLLVVFIAMYIASMAFSLPGVIYGYAKMGVFSGEVDPETMMEGFMDPVAIFLNLLNTVAQILLFTITVVTSGLIYFDLNERKNHTGTMERIKNLGNTIE